MKATTAILILAAGNSSRMGFPKQLLPWKETTLLGHSIEQALGVQDTNVFVVLGANKKSVEKSIMDYKVNIIYNENWKNGIGSSIAKGVGQIDAIGSYSNVLIVLADQPSINSQYLEKLLRSFEKKNAQIMLTQYKDISGIPVVFSKKYFFQLKALSGDLGAKLVVKKNKGVVMDCFFDTLFQDVDTLEMYNSLRKK